MNPETELRRPIIFAVCILSMLTGCFANVAPATCLTTIAAELGLDQTNKGFLLSVSFWGSAATILLSGPLADRWGFRIILITSAVIQSCGLCLAARAVHYADLLVGVLVLGCGRGLVTPLLTAIICELYPKRRSQAINLLHGFYPIGVVLTITLILAFFYLGWSWRHAFAVLAVLVLSYGVAVLPIKLPSCAHESPDRMPARQVLRSRSFALLAAGTFLAGVTEIGTTTWIPDYIEEAAGGSTMSGGMSLMLFALTMAAGRFAASAMGHRFVPKLLFTSGAVICIGGMLMVSIAQPFWLTMVCFSGLGLGAAALMPTAFASGGDRFPQSGATMYSVLVSCAMFGGAVGPTTIGVVADAAGLRAGIATLAVAPLLAILVMWRFFRSSHSGS